jgi:squalene-hopene/tetraprenyl-beta-curcumene cyclase
MMYLTARPALDRVAPSDGRVRAFFEKLVLQRWEKSGLRYEPESLVVAVPLAIHDGRTTGKLHPATRRALDRMISLQRPEGNWMLVLAGGKRAEVAGEKQAFFLGYEQMLFAAVGIAAAPESYGETEAAQAALERIREYVRRNPATTLHQKGMLLWAASRVEGLMNDEERVAAIAALTAKQRSDGGWGIAGITAGAPKFDPGKSADESASDGYATGFAVFTLRQGGVAATDKRIRRGVAWLKANQRESGRWFVPSFNKRPNSVITNSATAYAVLALEACGEL